ncbi:hypothetical protein FRC08_015168, partial [Ceratobasidium sp. 394]
MNGAGRAPVTDNAFEQQSIELGPYTPSPRTRYPSSLGRPLAARLPYSSSETSILRFPAQSPGPHNLEAFRSQSTLDLLSPRSIPESIFHSEYSPQPRRRPSFQDLSNSIYYNSSGILSTGTTEDLSPLLTPPTSRRSQYTATRLPTVPIPQTSSEQPWVLQGRGFMSKFEPVPIKLLIIHTLLCFIAFPFVYLLCSVGSGRSLFLSRAIVGGVCGLTGLMLGYNLVQLSRRGMEAALWATIVHESMRPEGGVTLEQLNNYVANPGSPGAAVSLLLRRIFRHTGAKRMHRGKYDKTPWTLIIIVFLFATAISACLVFIFARIVDIYTQQERQLEKYVETSVIGDLSVGDAESAARLISQVYSNYNFTWSLIPIASGGVIPIGRYFAENRLKLNPQASRNVTDFVYFAETYPSQLVEGGFGFGTFANQYAAALSAVRSPATQSEGQVLRWPRWGIRAGCMVLGNLDKILVPFSSPNNMTYLFVPKTAMYSLFASMDIPYPTLPPVNFTALMIPGDTPPANVVSEDIAVA